MLRVIGEMRSKTFPSIEPVISGVGGVGFILQPVAKIKSKHIAKNIPGDGSLAGFTFFSFLINNNNDKNLLVN
jgi:hypothetical protein